jgi:phenylpropionate dioxygenase-like ring-hydroxylating dioxygenase large terminal subunit
VISQEKNDEITLVGADQPAGRVLRQYWMPAALSDELMGARPVVPVTLMGENLVLFRNESGALGLIGRHCPHRGADMCFGRLEDNGLRCPFHGWHFDVNGACVEQPAEPEGSKMFEQVSTTAYPVVERGGIVWAFMGQGDAPEFPDFDCFRAPESHVFAFKGLWDCNWLQALEVGIDPAHASFLHRFLQDEDPADAYGKQFRDRAAGSELTGTQVLRMFPRPDIRVAQTDYGLQLTSLRDLGDGQTHVRVTNQIFPCAITIPMSREMTITQWHVPIDDTSCYWYSMFTSFTGPVDKVKMREQRLKEHRLPDYAPIKGKHNNYGYDPKEQETLTYTGMGLDINVHDQWAVESMGAIQDRRDEHLGKSDIAIIAYRRRLRAAITALAAGKPAEMPMQNGATAGIRGPRSVDTVAPSDGWEAHWPGVEDERRTTCPWDAVL